MKRNLIYHLTPIGNWQRNLNWLAEYWDVFDGLKMIAITHPDHSVNTVEIYQRLPLQFDGAAFIKNDPELRETRTLPVLLEQLRDYADPDSITFYGHSKGTTYPPNDPTYDAVQLWTECCYRKNLRDMDLVHTLLQHFPIAGSFRRLGQFANFPPASQWHYSGTFFWFRNRDLFARDWRAAIEPMKYGAEAFPSMLYRAGEAAVIFADNCQSLYNHRYLTQLIALWEAAGSPHDLDRLRGNVSSQYAGGS